MILSLENLLNASKSQNLPNETHPAPPVHEEIILDDRHERTGSVKFADQSDEGKEVRKILF
jgi:hypothetical protein